LDFLRTRAIPALIAALSCAAAAADCTQLDGKYPMRSGSGADEASLADLVQGAQRKNLYTAEGRSAPKDLAPTAPLARPKVTWIATTATLAYRAEGATLRFADREGRMLAELGINSTGRWSCKGSQLERRSERMSGVGDIVRTERVVQSLSREGDTLVLAETVTIVDPPGGTPKRKDARFKAIR
jgi:hypothetical protein